MGGPPLCVGLGLGDGDPLGAGVGADAAATGRAAGSKPRTMDARAICRTVRAILSPPHVVPSSRGLPKCCVSVGLTEILVGSLHPSAGIAKVCHKARRTPASHIRLKTASPKTLD